MASLEKFRAVDIRLDKANEYYIETQFAKEGDYNGRDLVVQITNAGEVTSQTGVTLNLGWKHEAVGNKGLDPFEVVDASQGIFKISYPTEMLNAGTVVAVIQVVENTKITLTRNFKITVEKSPVDESAVVSENSFTVLQDALLTVNQYDNRIANVENTKVDKSTFEQNKNEVTAQLQQTEQSLNAQLAHKAKQDDLEVERARIDAFTTLASGSTTGDAELIDARIGADGITYPSAGSANRAQFGEIKNDLDNTTTRSINLMPIGVTTLELNGVTSVYNDGIMTLSGVSTSQGGRTNKRVSPFTLASGTYTIRAYPSVTIDTLWLHKTSDNSVIASGFNVVASTFTLSESTEMYIGFNTLELNHDYTATIKIQLEKGTSANEFQVPSYITSNDLVARKDIAGLIDDDNESYTSTYSSKKIKEMTAGGGLLNPLFGLKLVVAGDSIQAGESTAYEFGSLARDHYGLAYLNTAMGGRTMADVKVNGVSRNGFAVDRYTLVPEDTDILTIMFGYNDQAYGWVSKRDDYCMATYGVLYQGLTAEQKTAVDTYKTEARWVTDFIGVITDTDTSTWCGAWNFVLDYFVIQKSIERIGVILPYGVVTAYIEPLKTLCKRYGVAYIDSANPNEIPSVGYSNAPFARSGHYRDLYTYDGLHPNEAGYKRMARGYIPWLAKI